jgi:hypothetical protein
LANGDIEQSYQSYNSSNQNGDEDDDNLFNW